MPPTGWVPATKADSKAPAKKAGAIKKKTPARKPGPRKLAPARNLCVAAESFDDGAVKKKTTARKPGPRKLAPVRNLCVAEESFDDVFPDDDWGIEIVTYRGKGQAIPSTPFNLQFESDDEDDDYSGRGSEFRRALEHRSDYRFMWGKQVSETVHDLVVGKPGTGHGCTLYSNAGTPHCELAFVCVHVCALVRACRQVTRTLHKHDAGASVVLKAGVRSDEQDIIVVGRKGSVISTQDFSKVWISKTDCVVRVSWMTSRSFVAILYFSTLTMQAYIRRAARCKKSNRLMMTVPSSKTETLHAPFVGLM